MADELFSQNRTVIDDAVTLQAYYDRTATQSMWVFYGLTTIKIVLTACIPLIALAAPQSDPLLYGGLGGSVLVVEAVLAMIEPGKKWRRYRAADMAIQSEVRLYRAKAKQYEGVDDLDKKLAERLDGITTAEHRDWQAIQDRITETKKTPRGPKR